MAKNVLIINGSPIVGGNTQCLAEELAKGAEEAGHTVEVIRLNDLHIAPYTGMQQKVSDDDMKQVLDSIVGADVIVLASPVYWMFFSAQIKTMMDRLSFDMKDTIAGKEVAMLLCAASQVEMFCPSMTSYYQMCFVGSLGWKDRGIVAAGGVYMPGDVKTTSYMKQAYELGKSL